MQEKSERRLAGLVFDLLVKPLEVKIIFKYKKLNNLIVQQFGVSFRENCYS
jgi:hypothetical protein